MGVPAKLTERQIKFAELLVYNEGRISASEAAYQAGYKTRPRQAASELRNPKVSPLVVKYIGELRSEVQEKYGINFEKHISELAQIRTYISNEISKRLKLVEPEDREPESKTLD